MLDVDCGLPQGSLILPILFLIYIKEIYPKIEFNIDSINFVNVIIYSNNKTTKQNCIKLTKIALLIFAWAQENCVKFDNSKSELIHFKKLRKVSNNTIILPNRTILKPKIVVK